MLLLHGNEFVSMAHLENSTYIRVLSQVLNRWEINLRPLILYALENVWQ